MYSELMYAGKTLEEIAGLSTVQITWVLCRRRDQYGRLIRANGLPEHVLRTMDAEGKRVVSGNKTRPYKSIFMRTWQRRGDTEQQAEARWDEYCQQRRESLLKMRRGGK
jgi:hypothetical protein